MSIRSTQREAFREKAAERQTEEIYTKWRLQPFAPGEADHPLLQA
jgi:hypothetical protein